MRLSVLAAALAAAVGCELSSGCDENSCPSGEYCFHADYADPGSCRAVPAGCDPVDPCACDDIGADCPDPTTWGCTPGDTGGGDLVCGPAR